MKWKQWQTLAYGNAAWLGVEASLVSPLYARYPNVESVTILDSNGKK